MGRSLATTRLEKRKQLVRAMSEILGEDAAYQGAPSFAYCVDGYTVSRNGLVTCPDTATHADARNQFCVGISLTLQTVESEPWKPNPVLSHNDFQRVRPNLLSDENRSNEHVRVRTVTVRWQSQNYNIIQVDGMTCKIEQA